MTNNDVRNAPVNDEERTSPSKRLIGSAVVIAAIVVLGLVLTLANLLSAKKETPPAVSAPSPSVTASATATSTPSEASVCGLTAVEMTGTVAAPPAATWTLVGTTAAPAIKDQGPGKIEDDGYRSCYARTPTGALLSASNLLAMGGEASLLGRKMTENSTVPGPGRDAALARPLASPDTSGVRIQIAGFRVLKYDGQSADVDIALRTSKGAIAAQVFSLKWVDGDWKVVLAPTGDLPTPMSQLPSLAGYISWSGA